MAQNHEVSRHSVEAISMGRDPDEDFQRIFERYYKPISGFFAKRGFSREESRDLTQETFLRVYKGMETYRQEAGVKTWVFTIAANLYRNELRARRTEKRSAREVSLEEALERGRPVFGRHGKLGRETPAAAGLDGLLTRERARLLRSAVEELPPRMRRCVLLWLDQGLKYREIAVILQVSVETVKAQLFQARKHLLERLAEHFTGFDLQSD